MATKRGGRSGPKTVVLVDPAGNDYESSSPAEISNLVYGQGYKPADTKTPLAEQIAALAAAEPAAAPAAAAPVAPQPTTEA